MKTTKILAVIITLLTLDAIAADSSSYPVPASRKRQEDFGSILGGKGGITLYDNANPNAGALGGSKSAAALNVNQYLWKASLNTLGFMPLASADSAGGVIVTDWYEDPSFPGERYKVNIVITSQELRVESLKITTFKQVLKAGNWREVPVNPKVSMDLEEKILTQARELNVGHH